MSVETFIKETDQLEYFWPQLFNPRYPLIYSSETESKFCFRIIFFSCNSVLKQTTIAVLMFLSNTVCRQLFSESTEHCLCTFV